MLLNEIAQVRSKAVQVNRKQLLEAIKQVNDISMQLS